MKTLPYLLAIGSLSLTGALSTAPAPAAAQEKPAAPAPEKSSSPSDTDRRAEAYYQYTMGHLWEGYYEATGRSEFATQAIEAYKKAYEIDPTSSPPRPSKLTRKPTRSTPSRR